jgi:alpha-glucosidase (family GH31 glycosyl hydrolase)
MSISLNATHSGGAKEIDVHNLYGHMNAKKVAFVIKEGTDMSLTGKRFIVFSDSTFAGSGKHSAVAINNLWRSWSSLKTLISQTMSFSMYGVSNVASDVCGSYGVIDYELCGRWA